MDRRPKVFVLIAASSAQRTRKQPVKRVKGDVGSKTTYHMSNQAVFSSIIRFLLR